MCGLVGMVGRSSVNQSIYDALTVLQHRGQDAAGIMTFADGNFHQRKSEGLVRDVFRQQHMQRLQGLIGIGHVRYPTAGSSGPALAQPFYVNSPYGISPRSSRQKAHCKKFNAKKSMKNCSLPSRHYTCSIRDSA